jgi:hypothetical protein
MQVDLGLDEYTNLVLELTDLVSDYPVLSKEEEEY